MLDFQQSHAPSDIATCMYYTGIDPFSKQEVYIARGLRDRKMQRALMQPGRTNLTGGCDALSPAQPPKEALEKRRKQANAAVQGDHYHIPANPSKGERPGEHGLQKGYRPGRKRFSTAAIAAGSPRYQMPWVRSAVAGTTRERSPAAVE